LVRDLSFIQFLLAIISQYISGRVLELSLTLVRRLVLASEVVAGALSSQMLLLLLQFACSSPDRDIRVATLGVWSALSQTETGLTELAGVDWSPLLEHPEAEPGLVSRIFVKCGNQAEQVTAFLTAAALGNGPVDAAVHSLADVLKASPEAVHHYSQITPGIESLMSGRHAAIGFWFARFVLADLQSPALWGRFRPVVRWSAAARSIAGMELICAAVDADRELIATMEQQFAFEHGVVRFAEREFTGRCLVLEAVAVAAPGLSRDQG
jgi:hypothetical protein